MTRPLQLLTLTIPLLAAGCGPTPFADWIDRDSPPLDDLLVTGPARSSPSPPAPVQRSAGRELDIPANADVEYFVQTALRRNPAIRSAEEQVRRLANRIPQARSLDDPMLAVAPFGDMAETAAGEVSVMTSISQKLPLPAKLDRRGRIAAQDAAEAAQELQRVRIEVVADTQRAWWSFYFTVRAIEVTGRNRDLLADLRDVAEAKYRAGTATQQDVLRAYVEMGKLDDELIELQQRLTTARAMLNRLIDRAVDASIPVPATRDLDPLRLDFETLVTEAERTNPEIARMHERIEGYRQRLALARLNRWPDLTLSFSYNLVDGDGVSPVANGDDQWWVGAGINLPIWFERLEAAEHEAVRGIFQSIAALDDARNRVAFRVQDALVRAESQQQ
ncbi:MAG: TolC family protein, partial [Planctomycetota bacterium]